jgi:hypothetical protein
MMDESTEYLEGRNIAIIRNNAIITIKLVPNIFKNFIITPENNYLNMYKNNMQI